MSRIFHHNEAQSRRGSAVGQHANPIPFSGVPLRFAFGLAAWFALAQYWPPIAFSQLPPVFPTPAAGLHAAGLIVGSSLVRLHWMGLVCGLIFLAVLGSGQGSLPDDYSARILVLAMMLLTAYSQFSIIPKWIRLVSPSAVMWLRLPLTIPAARFSIVCTSDRLTWKAWSCCADLPRCLPPRIVRAEI